MLHKIAFRQIFVRDNWIYLYMLYWSNATFETLRM